MKLIFLDVDGVLNNFQWANQMAKEGVQVYRDDLLFEPSILLLKKLVDETGARIVLSSAWRRIPSARNNLIRTLERYNLFMCSETPYTGSVRGYDIQAWFNRNPGDYSYVILDDECDMLSDQESHLVQTDFYSGFQHEDYLKAKKILEEVPVFCGTEPDPEN